MNTNMNPSSSSPNDRRVLTVRVASAAEVFDDLERVFDAIATNERPEQRFEVIVQHEEDLRHLLSSNNVTLLRTIAREHPQSIRETARLVDRDVHQVHDNLMELERLNLVRFEHTGSSKRPIVWYDDIDIELPIAPDEQSAAPA